MTTYVSLGDRDASLTDAQVRAAVQATLAELGPRRKVLPLPPDYTRAHSGAGAITRHCHEYLGEALRDVMPTLGTHRPMARWQIERMYPGVPLDRFRVHDWRHDVSTLGEVSGAFVSRATEGAFDRPWPAELNRLVHQGGHDLILSIGQVVPHEVVGMANHTKNLFSGDDQECFTQAAALSVAVNISMLAVAPTRMVVHLDADEFHSTWLRNKAIYRTRMAIADGGELVVLAPGVERFGEDPHIDALIRRYVEKHFED